MYTKDIETEKSSKVSPRHRFKKSKLSKRLEKECQSMTLNPPFTSLPSFNATAMIISYAVSRENARQLIMRLSKNSIGYYYKHKLILKEFLSDNIRLTRTLEFGCLEEPWKH